MLLKKQGQKEKLPEEFAGCDMHLVKKASPGCVHILFRHHNGGHMRS